MPFFTLPSRFNSSKFDSQRVALGFSFIDNVAHSYVDHVVHRDMIWADANEAVLFATAPKQEDDNVASGRQLRMATRGMSGAEAYWIEQEIIAERARTGRIVVWGNTIVNNRPGVESDEEGAVREALSIVKTTLEAEYLDRAALTRHLHGILDEIGQGRAELSHP